ncbi:MAG: preprotein translocase subunit SecA [Gemmatimonadetes bacterium]|nr:MAG: preprotein translocase subunit SecA [Gemmatimonadetes bacterium 13_1_20CM_4_69_16]PYO13224.1 MAG: preprotein translocase subunit SecA [Gemmatimonadota bacterium]
MFKRLVTKVFGTRFQRELKRIQPLVDAIHRHEARLQGLSDAELRAQTPKFRAVIAERTGALAAEVERLRQSKHDCADAEERLQLSDQLAKAEHALAKELQGALDGLLAEAFATVREACRRLTGSKLVVTAHELTWDMVPYDVQLIGGIVLHQGRIAEMATGEGKTLVATLPLYLNALAGRGAHLVTVNNYLARRDSQWMGHLFSWLGLTVGCIDDTEPGSPERRQAYLCDITYGTNNEFGFDYLRDNMVVSPDHRVQRGHVYAIIDEVDSILIDEARTPLIISGPVGTESNEKYALHNAQVVQLVRKQTAVVNDLIAKAEPPLGDEKTAYEGARLLYKAQLGMPKNKKLMKLLQETGVKSLVQRVELDRLADRKLPARDQKMRDVEDDLYFVMDERGRSVHLTDKGVEAMSPQDPTLFVVPDISHAVHEIDHDETLSAKEKVERRRTVEAEYAQKSETLHIIHKLLQAHMLYDKDVEYVVQDGQVLIVDEFTGRLMHGRRWSDGLHQAVEAKEGVAVREENQTLATITIQNYFRMYQKLAGMTGTAETEEREFWEIYKLDVMVIPTNRPVRRIDKHDLIYKTRREKYNAILDELERQHQRGLPVLVGTVSVDVSETLSRMIKRRGLRHEVLNAKQHQREAEIVAQAGQPGAITIATNMAGRGTDIKLGPGVKKCQVCGIMSHEPAFGQQVEQPDLTQPEIKKLGCYEDPPCGLVIIGTERHEARRIDRQLRGRSGRQGDPGQSVFFLSLEDDLMRLFGSDRIARWMDRTGAEEGEVITHPWVTGAISQAQKRVELQHFQARKKLLEYDDVMNQQREVIYSLRQFALEGGEELKAEALRMVEVAVERLVDGLIAEFDDPGQWDRALIETELLQKFLISVPGVTDPTVIHNRDDLVRAAQQAAREAFQAKLDHLKSMEKDVEAQLRAQAGSVRLAERALSRFMLGVIDEKWKDHLYDLDQLREGIYYRSWGQKDPLVEYKTEAFDMFKGLMSDIENTFAEGWFKDWWRNMPIEIAVPGAGGGPPSPGRTLTGPAGGQPGGARRPAPMVATKAAADGLITSAEPAAARAPSAGVVAPALARNPYADVGRNDPCPCGSGKKFKKCHGAAM